MGSREQAGESGNGEWQNKKKWELLRGCNLKSLRVLKMEKKKTNSACIFTHTRIK